MLRNLQVIILMKAKPSKKQKKAAVRKSAGKVKMSATASGLTSQAGLIPVVKFLERIGFEQTVNQTVPHKRGDNADYQLTDMMLLTVVGVIGGATSIAKLCTVWSDGVLRKVAGWLKRPVETTVSRLFKEVTEKQIGQLESVTINYADRFGARPTAQACLKLDWVRCNGSILIPPLIRCAAVG